MNSSRVTSLESRATAFLWKWMLRCLRAAIWKADEWCYAQEQSLKQEATKAEFAAEVDPVASTVRERAIVRQRKPRRRGMTAAEFDQRFVRPAAGRVN